METVSKQGKKRIASSIAFVSSFRSSSFKKDTSISQEECSAFVAPANTKKAIVNPPGLSTHEV